MTWLCGLVGTGLGGKACGGFRLTWVINSLAVLERARVGVLAQAGAVDAGGFLFWVEAKSGSN